jgi:hypothetical protein
MNRYSRRRNWSSGFRRRYGGSRYGRSSGIVRRARGNQRAANQQADASDVVINLMTSVKSGVTEYEIGGKIHKPGVSATNIYALLEKSDFYKSYANMYDQFRVTSIKVKVTPTSWQVFNQFNLTGSSKYNGTNGAITPEGVQNLDENIPEFVYPQALTVITAWDRSGLDLSQINTYTAIGTDTNSHKWTETNIGNDITTYSSAKTQQLIAGATFNCIRYLYPSSQQEKSCYYSTGDLYKEDLDGFYWYQKQQNENWGYSGICNLVCDPSVPFKPTFLIGILDVDGCEPATLAESDNASVNEFSDANSKKKIHPVTFNLEFDIGVTFRGLRKAQVV